MARPTLRKDVFQALANPTRRKVLERLSRGPATVMELAAPFDISLPTFLEHLDVLEETGLMRSSKPGRFRTCELVPHRFTVAEKWIAARRKAWERQRGRRGALSAR